MYGQEVLRRVLLEWKTICFMIRPSSQLAPPAPGKQRPSRARPRTALAGDRSKSPMVPGETEGVTPLGRVVPVDQVTEQAILEASKV